MSKKAQALASAIASELAIRLKPAGLAVVEDTAADLMPLVKVGPQTAGSKSALIKVLPQDWPLAKDILGLAATIFGPHKIQVVLESNPSAGAGADIHAMDTLLPILAVCALKGARLEVYQSAAGNSVGVEDIVSGNLKATFDNLHGMIGNQ